MTVLPYRDTHSARKLEFLQCKYFFNSIRLTRLSTLLWLLAPGMDINNKHIDKRKCYGHILCSPPIIGDGHVVVKAPFGNWILQCKDFRYANI